MIEARGCAHCASELAGVVVKIRRANTMAAAIAGEDIGTAFDRCWDTVQSVLNSDAEGSAPPGAAESGPAPDAEALAQLASLVKRIRSERVLSANEELSDIPTGHIRYLLPDFWRAKILQRRHVPAQRLPALRGARAALLTFLQSLQRLGALRKEEASLVGEDLIDDEEGMTFDPAQRRAYLVGRAKFRAELQGRVGSVAWSGEAEADGVGAGAGDDEDTRGRRLDALQLAALEAVDDLGHIAAELPMLRMMVARAAPTAAEAHAAAAAGDGRMRPAEAERLAKEEAAIAAVTAPDRPGIVRDCEALRGPPCHCAHLPPCADPDTAGARLAADKRDHPGHPHQARLRCSAHDHGGVCCSGGGRCPCSERSFKRVRFPTSFAATWHPSRAHTLSNPPFSLQGSEAPREEAG